MSTQSKLLRSVPHSGNPESHSRLSRSYGANDMRPVQWPLAARCIATLLLCVPLVVGCSSWRIENQPVASLIESQEEPPRLRVTLADGRRLDLRDSRLVGDSVLIGAKKALNTDRWRQDSVRVVDVQLVEIRRHSSKKTAWLIGGTLVGLFATFAILVGAGLSANPIP